MKLKDLIEGMKIEVKGSKEKQITGLCLDSRTVSPGNLFIAKHPPSIPQALAAGAAAVLTDLYDPFLNIPQLIHPFSPSLIAKLAARYYGNPSHQLCVVGVTGTKGKTTTTYLIKHLLEGLGTPTGLIGTIETIIQERRFDSTLTTHDVIFNQKWLKEMVQTGCKSAVLEVSSHGLDQGRVDEIAFEFALFTNLYPDHLDYHKTIEQYAAAKRKLFERAKKAILNADSPWAKEMKGEAFTFGIERGDLKAEEIVFTSQGSEFKIGGCKFFLPLLGKFNLYNALGAIALALQTGASLEKISTCLANFDSVPARLERIGNVFIDFAHTGEALENALSTLKEIAKGRIIVVFGCGGQRDPQRRTAMAMAAEKWADLSIITTDNPRNEDPNEIIRQICQGFKKAPLQEIDRKKAIQMALELASPDDLILIAGKGHERMQIFQDRSIPFQDREVVKELQSFLKRSE